MLEKDVFFLKKSNQVRLMLMETRLPFKAISYGSIAFVLLWVTFCKFNYSDHYFSNSYDSFFYWPIYVVLSLNIYLKIIDRKNYFKIEKYENSIIVTKFDFTSNPYSIELPRNSIMHEIRRNEILLRGNGKSVKIGMRWKVKIDDEGEFKQITARELVALLEK